MYTWAPANGRRARREVSSPAGAHLAGQDAWVLGPVVPHRAHHGDLAEARCQELLEEGAAFPGPGYSGEPALLAVADLGGNRLTQYELRGAYRPARP